MSTTITHPEVDVAVLGLGMFGGSLSLQLSTAGYKVVGIERGPYWSFTDDFVPQNVHNEWDNDYAKKFDLPLSLQTVTFRHNFNQMALPFRYYQPLHSTNPFAYGVGGLSTHWGAVLGRMAPWGYEARSYTISKYGQAGFDAMLPANGDVQDWPVTYEQVAPYATAFEQEIGVAGTNQDPFTPNVQYPVPPSPFTPLGSAFQTAAEALGYHPYPSPCGVLSEPYMNQYGVTRSGCVYCGFCYNCETGAKISSCNESVPGALKTGNFDLVTSSLVSRINTNSAGTLATGVTYYDQQGNVNIQPAKVVVNSTWGFWLTRLMLLSGIGNPFNPTTVTGTLGRGMAWNGDNTVSSVSGTMPNLGGNNFGGGANVGGFTMQDLMNDNFDHTGLNFFSGCLLNIGATSSSPGFLGSLKPGATNFGSAWKASAIKNSSIVPVGSKSISISGGTADVPTTGTQLDLDPHYNDLYGDPLPRCTYDYNSPQYWAPSMYLLPQFEAIAQKMGATNIKQNKVQPYASHISGKTTNHIRGGARIHADPTLGVFNMWQQSWTVQNLFGVGEFTDTYGDETGSGSAIAGPMVYVAGDGIKQYLTNPGPLATG